MDKKFLIFLAIALLVGGVAGFVVGRQSLASKIAKLETVKNSATSPIIRSSAAYGKVTKIDGKKITLSYNKDQLVVTMRPDASVTEFVMPQQGGAPQQQKSDAGKIKIGDTLNVNVTFMPDGIVVGADTLIISAAK